MDADLCRHDGKGFAVHTLFANFYFPAFPASLRDQSRERALAGEREFTTGDFWQDNSNPLRSWRTWRLCEIYRQNHSYFVLRK
jgi:hypothetical protein